VDWSAGQGPPYTTAEISSRSLLVSAGSGAIGVGIAGKLGQVGGLLADAVISAGSTAAKGEDFSALGVMADVALGKAGAKMAANVFAGSSSYQVALRQVDRLERIGDKPGARAAQRERAEMARPALELEIAQNSAKAGLIAGGAGQAAAKDMERRFEQKR
jgi:hypothetical protein